MRRILILAEGHFRKAESKTANCVIRYLQEKVVGVIDSTRAGKTAQDLLGFGGAIPVVGSLAEGLALRPTEILVGVAPRGGELDPSWKNVLLQALRAGVTVVNGLHTFLGGDPRFVRAARDGGAFVRDLRRYEGTLRLPKARPWPSTVKVILTVGTDCNVGKMTASWELAEALKRLGHKAAFVPTGQTGIYLAGWGVPVDALKSDFISGAVEGAVARAVRRLRPSVKKPAYVVVEGQGTIGHPAYSGVALGILHGACPDAMILCHEAGRVRIAGYPAFAIPPMREIILRHEAAASFVKPSRVAAVALNRMRLSDIRAKDALRRARKESRLPVADPVAPGGAEALARAVIQALKRFSSA